MFFSFYLIEKKRKEKKIKLLPEHFSQIAIECYKHWE